MSYFLTSQQPLCHSEGKDTQPKAQITHARVTRPPRAECAHLVCPITQEGPSSGSNKWQGGHSKRFSLPLSRDLLVPPTQGQDGWGEEAVLKTFSWAGVFLPARWVWTGKTPSLLPWAGIKLSWVSPAELETSRASAWIWSLTNTETKLRDCI